MNEEILNNIWSHLTEQNLTDSEYEQWKNNPDIKLNMIMYMGMPLFWPNGEIFGTICVLDNKVRRFDESFQKLMWEYKEAIESDFKEIQSSPEKE